MKVTIDIDEIIHEAFDADAIAEHTRLSTEQNDSIDGWSSAIMDALDSLYGVEAAIHKRILQLGKATK